jgi:hypothetical protein
VKYENGSDGLRTDINIAYLLPPPWSIKEFFIMPPDGQVAICYSIVTRQSSEQPVAVTFKDINPDSEWRGDMVVLRHNQDPLNDLMDIGTGEISVIISAIVVMGRD